MVHFPKPSQHDTIKDLISKGMRKAGSLGCQLLKTKVGKKDCLTKLYKY